MNVPQAIETFLRHGESERNLSDRTLRAYESDLLQFSAQVEGITADKITTAHLEHFVEKLGGGPYRETSIRRKVAALKVFFRYLEDSGFVPESPARKLKIRQSAEARIPNVLSVKEIRSLLSAPKREIEELEAERNSTPGARNRYFCAIRDNLIIELLFSTGIRIGELVALDVTDTDLESRRLKITGRATRGRFIEVTSAVVLDALRTYIALRSERSITTPALFVGRSGTRLTIYSIENIFKKYVKSADIKRHVTPHALRHTMAAMMLNSGAELRVVQEMLGHASILSTQVYMKVTPPRGRRAGGDGADRIAGNGSAARLPIRKK